MLRLLVSELSLKKEDFCFCLQLETSQHIMCIITMGALGCEKLIYMHLETLCKRIEADQVLSEISPITQNQLAKYISELLLEVDLLTPFELLLLVPSGGKTSSFHPLTHLHSCEQTNKMVVLSH